MDRFYQSKAILSTSIKDHLTCGVFVSQVPQRNNYTNSLISNLMTTFGIKISVFLQGSSGGYIDLLKMVAWKLKKSLETAQKIIKAPFQTQYGSYRWDFLLRVLIIPKYVVSNLKKKSGMPFELLQMNHINIIINLANEQNSSRYKDFKAFDFNKPKNIISLCEAPKKLSNCWRWWL